MTPSTSMGERTIASSNNNITTLIHNDTVKKRPLPLSSSSSVSKKRRGLVTRTHSPKSQSSPLSTTPYVQVNPKIPLPFSGFDVRKVSPTVRGVTEVSRLINLGKIVVLPTETVYMTCTSINPKEESSEALFQHLCQISPHPDHTPILFLHRPLASLRNFLTFPLKPYAIQEKDGKASPPIVFCEKKEVIHRLSQKFWPGPVTLYLRIADDTHTYLPTHICKDGKRFLGLSNPSHPLMSRFLNDTKLSSGNERIVIGMPTSYRNQEDNSLQYLTKAEDVCYHYCSLFSPASTTTTSVHVLDGEDKRELFTVPTCQYGMPSPTSLWIDDSIRTIYLRGSKDGPEETIFSSSLTPSLLSITQALELTKEGMPASSTDPQNIQNLDEHRRNRNRVVAAVLRKWKVIDQRTEA